MESKDLPGIIAAANADVAAKVAAAIALDGRPESTIATDSGIPQSTLRRKLAGLNGASFNMGELATLAAILHTPNLNPFASVSA